MLTYYPENLIYNLNVIYPYTIISTCINNRNSYHKIHGIRYAQPCYQENQS
jgi:hypothetical protein